MVRSGNNWWEGEEGKWNWEEKIDGRAERAGTEARVKLG